MQSQSTSWRWTIWIACFAVLMNALAPSMSHAMAAMNGVPATWELCRTDSGAAVNKSIEKVTGKNSGNSATPMADCGYCLPHGGSVALIPSAITGLGLIDGHALRPFLFYHAPPPLLALSASAPRGPPAFS